MFKKKVICFIVFPGKNLFFYTFFYDGREVLQTARCVCCISQIVVIRDKIFIYNEVLETNVTLSVFRVKKIFENICFVTYLQARMTIREKGMNNGNSILCIFF